MKKKIFNMCIFMCSIHLPSKQIIESSWARTIFPQYTNYVNLNWPKHCTESRAVKLLTKLTKKKREDLCR